MWQISFSCGLFLCHFDKATVTIPSFSLYNDAKLLCVRPVMVKGMVGVAIPEKLSRKSVEVESLGGKGAIPSLTHSIMNMCHVLDIVLGSIDHRFSNL